MEFVELFFPREQCANEGQERTCTVFIVDFRLAAQFGHLICSGRSSGNTRGVCATQAMARVDGLLTLPNSSDNNKLPSSFQNNKEHSLLDSLAKTNVVSALLNVFLRL